ncbi:SsgA family sporulation/cell division regulator [Streptomyces misionensis]|uniref:SsgA family sporulation/cell division regulator n=1 Tax=Streptomyces misionensis TaxID=67331 RepID=UPI0036BA7AC7
MTVRKDEPMDHLAVTTDDIDALLDASSLGAPHVLAETEPIPAATRRRMAQAADQHQGRPATCSGSKAAQAGEQDRPSTIPNERTDVIRDLHDVDTTGLALVVSDSVYEAVARFRTPFLQADSRPRRGPRPPLHGEGGEHMFAVAVREFRRPWLGSYAGLTQQMAPPGRDRWEAGGLWALGNRGFLRASLPPYFLRDPLTARHISCTGGGPRQGAGLLERRQLANGSREPCPAGWWFTRGGLLRHALTATSERPRGEMTTALSSMLPHEGRSWIDLQAYLRPVLAPTHEAMLDSARNQLLRPIAPPHLYTARFAPSAYPRTASGLHLPAGSAAPDRDAQKVPPAAPPATPAVLARKQRRARQWITVVNGVLTLRADVPMRIHPEEHEALTQQVRTRLTYRVCDPYAVEARFGAGSGNETVWTFSRDLLKDGLHEEAGLGDVIVWRGKEPRQQERVFIRLTSPEGKALLSAAEHDVRAFIEAAGRLVRYGLEHSYLQPMMDSFEATLGELARPGGRD